MLAANIATMVALKRTGARLARDVIFLATDDEEQGGAASIKATIQKYWDKIACAYALNEGGRVIMKDGKVQYVGDSGQRKSGLQRHRHRDRSLGPWLVAAAGQCGGASGGGRRETGNV